MQIRGVTIQSLDPVIKLMEAQLRAFDRQGDHRAAFLRVYLRMTQRVRGRLGAGFFADPDWLERVAIRFAAYYFRALDAFAAGGQCPPAWHCAFTAARSRRTFVLQDVLLGVNAHINNDLPQVLADILAAESDWPPGPRLLLRRFDHDQINRLLHELIPIVEGEVARHYGRLLGVLGWLMGRLDQLLGAYGLKLYRDAVWRKAEFLLAASRPEQRAVVKGFVEQDAAALARQIEERLALRGLRRLAPLCRRWRLC